MMAYFQMDAYQNMDNYGALSCKRVSPPSRASARRFHPYMVGNGAVNHNLGAMYPAYNNNVSFKDLEVNNMTAYNQLAPSTSPRTSLDTSGAGFFLTNALAYQDYSQMFGNIDLQQQLYALRCLQEVCTKGTGTTLSSVVPVSASQSTTTVAKDHDHPFYWRRRAAPTEGMTRTRDKYRVVYTEKQRVGLEKEYDDNKFITSERKAELSKELDLSDRQIKIWFQNRRAKERRNSRKSSKNDKENLSLSDNTDTESGTLSPQSLDNTGSESMTSCRFAGNQSFSPESYSTGQCVYQNSNTQRAVKDTYSHNTGLETSTSGLPTSPSSWNVSPSNGYIPQLNVSPLTVNMDFGFIPRL